jgi:HEAT repeat protein
MAFYNAEDEDRGTATLRLSPFLQKGVCLFLLGLVVWLDACGERSPEPYFEQLGSLDEAKRLQAANALLRYGDEVVPRLIEEYDSGLIRVRFEVVKLLGRIKDERAVPVLIEALGDKSAFVAGVAAWSLGELRAPAALGPLLNYAHDGSKVMRGEVIRSLGTCHSYELEPILSDSARKEISRVLRDPEPDMKIKALRGMHEFGYRGAVEEIIRMSRDPSAEVRHVAVQALGHIAVGSAPNAAEVTPRMRNSIVEALTVALDEVDYQTIRTKAVRALDQIGDPQVVPHLERLYQNGSEEDRREIRRVLEKLGGTAAQ